LLLSKQQGVGNLTIGAQWRAPWGGIIWAFIITRGREPVSPDELAEWWDGEQG
jgi:hypothetical protein